MDDDNAVRLACMKMFWTLSVLVTVLELVGAWIASESTCTSEAGAAVTPETWLLARTAVTQAACWLLFGLTKWHHRRRTLLMSTAVALYSGWTLVWEVIGIPIADHGECVSPQLRAILLLSLYAGVGTPMSLGFAALWLTGQLRK